MAQHDPVNIVFLDRNTIPAHIVLPTPQHPHHWQAYGETQPSDVIARLQDADIAITNKVVIDETVLTACPKLKLIAVAATGVNNVDLAACQAQGVQVCNVQGYATQSVPEHVIAMIFALKRQLLGYHQDVQNGEWQKQGQFCFFTHPIGSVAGSTLGIIGKGALGEAVAQLARALGMKVVFAEHRGAQACRPGYLPFEHVLCQSDVLSLHCPLTDNTHHLIDQDTLALMPENAILINTGRGGLVNETALLHALETGQIGGAGLDVLSEEPAPNTHPLIAASLPNLLVTPHIAWGADEAVNRLANQLVDNIDGFLSGSPQHTLVD
ncbi:D-2-hydroxyacid dehydrogenase [Salinivibrio sp. VYel1]|uniref:D-2-hydroxyacid dehydrogenase n=1 Tax=Salinivibrio sp. VYel1 TaxID=2490490 RepID=UPI00128D198C|nr:D-2-hydroxyacid dehydrogenase [Salinivibrio sp. VYel1]MPX90940.1 D-2-hydroxyacid dehydrogenase [Salinivibrio sp. VYel1]